MICYSPKWVREKPNVWLIQNLSLRTELLWKASPWTPQTIQSPGWLPLTFPRFPQLSHFSAFCILNLFTPPTRRILQGVLWFLLGELFLGCVPAFHGQQPGTQSKIVFSAKRPDGISGPLSLSGLVPWNLASWKQQARRAPPAVPCHMLGHPSVDPLSGLCEEDPAQIFRYLLRV